MKNEIHQMTPIKGKRIAIGVSVLLGLWLLIEVVSISSWSATTTLGYRVGVIEYRDSFGGFNKVSMRVNDSIMWVFGYEFLDVAVYGTFGTWAHTYSKAVSE